MPVPLDLFSKPQSPAERLAAQQRDQEKLQRVQELAEEARGKGKGQGCDEEARACCSNKPPSLSPFAFGPLWGYCCM